MLLAVAPSPAAADTLTPSQYDARLVQVRALIQRAASLPPSARGPVVSEARALLRLTDGIALAYGDTLRVDDSRLAEGIDTSDASLADAAARVEARLRLIPRATAIDPAVADARLRDVLPRAEAPATDGNVLSALFRLILRALAGLRGPGIDPGWIWPALGTLGLAVIAFIVATLGRALPERVRREVLLRGGVREAPIDPSVHLRAADAALASARPRDAIHALFLYAVAALTAREAIRYDPALTDRELLVRAAGIPHADAFRDLVGIYERSWFGLREPSADEAGRARELALRVAA